jgi:hypothetical protein
MTMKTVSKSVRTFIRKEKSRIRHTNADAAEQKKLIEELQDRYHKS